MNYKELLSQGAFKYKDKTALYYGDQRFSFQELEARTDQAAHAFLSLKVSKGTRVATILPPGLDMVTVFFGVTKIGGIAVTIDSRVAGDDLDYLLRDCQAQVVVSNSAILKPLEHRLTSFEHLKQVIIMDEAEPSPHLSYKKIASSCPVAPPETQVSDDDVDMIQYTSGTTGTPKGVLTTHESHYTSLRLIAETYGQTEKDIFLIPEMPPAWLICQLIGSWALGSPVAVVVQPGYLPFLEAVGRIKASIAFTPMPIIFQMDKMPDSEAKRFDLTSLRLLITGGLVPPQEIFKSIRGRFGIPLILGYACNEAGGWIALQPLDGSGKPGSSGKAFPGTQVKILDESGQQLGPNQVGEIIFRGPGMMKGYYNRPLATAEAIKNGWLFTGDLGKIDEDGNLFVIGRKKEVIKIGDGEILPTDIEEVLGAHPEISEVAVIGNDKGLKAVVVLKPGGRATAQDIINFSQKRLDPRDVPHTIEFVASLPRTLTGKIQRWALTK